MAMAVTPLRDGTEWRRRRPQATASAGDFLQHDDEAEVAELGIRRSLADDPDTIAWHQRGVGGQAVGDGRACRRCRRRACPERSSRRHAGC